MINYIAPNLQSLAALYEKKLFDWESGSRADLLPKMSKRDIENIRDRLNNEVFEKPVKLILSPYNCVREGDKKIIIYNTFTNALSKLSPIEYNQFLGKRRLSKDLQSKFLENGFLLANVDASKIYEEYRSALKNRSNALNINITSTMRCNARCSYCYELGTRKKDFTQDALERTIRFIIRQHRGGSIKINWFGGEPLLAPNAMDFISGGMRKAGIEYSSYLITNGSLITAELVRDKFPLWNIKDAQISLDGGQKTYAARKRYGKGVRDVFSRILDNILVLGDSGVKVHIRLNMDEKNADEIIELLPELQNRFAANSNVVYYPAFLTGVGSRLTDEERIAIVKKMYKAIDDPTKFNIADRLYSTPRMSACMREDTRSFSIDTSGFVYMCEHAVGRRKERIGTVNRLNHAKNDSRGNVDLRVECRECAYLPKCMGGCAENLKTNDPCCLIERYMIPAYLEFLAE